MARTRSTVGEVLMDASTSSSAPSTKADPHSPSLQFADGGSYSQAKLSEAILETEKTRKAFDAKTQAEAEERAAKESSLKQQDVDALIKEFSMTPAQAKTCLIESSGNLQASIESLFERDVMPGA